MNEVAAAANRHLAVVENRIARQSELIRRLEDAGRDATEAIRNLRLMHDALKSMRATFGELVGSDARWTYGQSVGKRKRSDRRTTGRVCGKAE